jgi:hypothetical protein
MSQNYTLSSTLIVNVICYQNYGPLIKLFCDQIMMSLLVGAVKGETLSTQIITSAMK